MSQPTLTEQSDRDTRRVLVHELHLAGREANALMAHVRTIRRDLAEDFIHERATDVSRAYLQEALELLAQAVTQVDEARRVLP